MEKDNCTPLIRQIHSALEREANHSLREQDLTISQVYLLLALRDSAEGACTCKELEKQLQLAQPTTVGLVKRLAQKEFVECHNDAEDRRVKIVKITDKGLTVCEQARSGINQTVRKLMSGLTEEEQTELLRLLQKVQHNICCSAGADSPYEG